MGSPFASGGAKASRPGDTLTKAESGSEITMVVWGQTGAGLTTTDEVFMQADDGTNSNRLINPPTPTTLN